MGRLWWSLTACIAVLSILLRQNLLFLLSLLLALMGGASILWTRVCLSGISYRRHFGNMRLFYGEQTTLAIEIVNAKPLPLAWLRAEDELPSALPLGPVHVAASHQPSRKRLVNLLSLRWYERVTRHYHVTGAARGAWSFGPVEVSSGDIFGFSLRHETLPGIDTLLVYPMLVPITVLGLPARRPFGDYSTPRRLSEDPLRLNGARDYIPGDSMRFVHWKATARRQQLQTKTFEPSASHPVAIFLNFSTYERAWDGIDPELQEYAITAAASLARWAWDNRYPVGLYANGIMQPQARPISIRPSSHRNQLFDILEALARAVGYSRWPIEHTLGRETARLPFGSTLVVVTAIMNDNLARTLRDLVSRHFGVTVITLGKACIYKLPPGVLHYPIGGRKEWDELAQLALA